MPERIDWFMGALFAGQGEVTEEMREVMVEHAGSYLRSCGTIGWAEWQLLGPLSRAAFEKAGQQIEEIKLSKLAELIAKRLEAAEKAS